MKSFEILAFASSAKLGAQTTNSNSNSLSSPLWISPFLFPSPSNEKTQNSPSNTLQQHTQRTTTSVGHAHTEVSLRARHGRGRRRRVTRRTSRRVRRGAGEQRSHATLALYAARQEVGRRFHQGTFPDFFSCFLPTCVCFQDAGVHTPVLSLVSMLERSCLISARRTVRAPKKKKEGARANPKIATPH